MFNNSFGEAFYCQTILAQISLYDWLNLLSKSRGSVRFADSSPSLRFTDNVSATSQVRAALALPTQLYPRFCFYLPWVGVSGIFQRFSTRSIISKAVQHLVRG